MRNALVLLVLGIFFAGCARSQEQAKGEVVPLPVTVEKKGEWMEVVGKPIVGNPKERDFLYVGTFRTSGGKEEKYYTLKPLIPSHWDGNVRMLANIVKMDDGRYLATAFAPKK